MTLEAAARLDASATTSSPVLSTSQNNTIRYLIPDQTEINLPLKKA